MSDVSDWDGLDLETSRMASILQITHYELILARIFIRIETDL